MTLLRCSLVLAPTLSGNLWPHASQSEPAKSDAKDVQSTIAGVWRGHSECAVKNSPCHDEVNVYGFSKIAGRTNAFSVTASKVVDGKEGVMGNSEWKYDEKKQVLDCESLPSN